MRQARLVRSKRVHRYRAAQAESLIAPNLLARRFDPAQRDQVWVGDITFVQTRQGWLYVAVGTCQEFRVLRPVKGLS
ncbi:hypothetical protein DP59_872 [Burkholderia pseudomallei]|nr:hypothetical protein DP59_872 [Burkholderia pseudomallei]